MRPIQACLRCGSRQLRMMTMADGLIPEATERYKWVCGDCNWQGTPLEFDDPRDHQAFLEGLAAGDGAGDDDGTGAQDDGGPRGPAR